LGLEGGREPSGSTDASSTSRVKTAPQRFFLTMEKREQNRTETFRKEDAKTFPKTGHGGVKRENFFPKKWVKDLGLNTRSSVKADPV